MEHRRYEKTFGNEPEMKMVHRFIVVLAKLKILPWPGWGYKSNGGQNIMGTDRKWHINLNFEE
jgi:hypothetical protein